MTSNQFYPFELEQIPSQDREALLYFESLWSQTPPTLSERQALRESRIYLPLLKDWESLYGLDPARFKLLSWFVTCFTLEEFYSPELQGVGDIESPLSDAHGVWVHSILASLSHLISKNRLQNETLYALHSLGSLFHKSTHKDNYLSLIRSVLFELAHPESITCFFPDHFSATLAQVLLALKEPAQYIELAEKVSSLEVLDVPRIFYFGTTLSSRMLQPALLENGSDLSDILSSLLWVDGAFQKISARSQPEAQALFEKVGTLVSCGEPVAVGLSFHQNPPDVLLLISRIDIANNLFCFFNLQGDHLSLPLSQFQVLIENTLLKEGAQFTAYVGEHLDPHPRGIEADALAQWPGSPLNTEPLSSYQMSHWFIGLALASALEPAQQTQVEDILAQCEKVGLFPLESYGRLASLFQHKSLIEPVVDRLKTIQDKDRLSHFLRLIDETSRSISQGYLPLEMGERILSDRPERYLTTLQMNQLVENIQEGKTDLIYRLLGRMDDNKDTLIRHCHVMGISHDKLDQWLKQGMSFLELEHFFMTLEPDDEMNQIVEHFFGSVTKMEALRSLFRRLHYLKTMKSQGILSEDEALQGLLYYQSGDLNGDLNG